MHSLEHSLQRQQLELELQASGLVVGPVRRRFTELEHGSPAFAMAMMLMLQGCPRGICHWHLQVTARVNTHSYTDQIKSSRSPKLQVQHVKEDQPVSRSDVWMRNPPRSKQSAAAGGVSFCPLLAL